MFVTTSYQPSSKEISQAARLASELGIPLVKREKYTMSKLYQLMGMKAAIIVAKNGWHYETKTGYQFSFHPNMAALRMKQLQKGQKDIMVACSGMTPGDNVLDCTMGMGADAIIASFVVGEKGKVVALESQPVIATIVKHGLQTYETDRKALKKAMKAIEVIQTDYRKFLLSASDQSFDLIFFDPMFRQTVEASTAMQQLKEIANPNPLDSDAVTEAMRVTRRAVLLKERRGSSEFKRLGFTVVHESASYAWGIIRKEGK